MDGSGKFLFKRVERSEELHEWLNEVLKQYKYFKEPVFSDDLCRCLIHVYTIEEVEGAQK